jgi:hypothetical protein
MTAPTKENTKYNPNWVMLMAFAGIALIVEGMLYNVQPASTLPVYIAGIIATAFCAVLGFYKSITDKGVADATP